MDPKVWYLPGLKAERPYTLDKLRIAPSEHGLCLDWSPGEEKAAHHLVLRCRAFRGCLLLRSIQLCHPELGQACLSMTDRPEVCDASKKVCLEEFFPFPELWETELGAVSLFERAAVLPQEREYLPALCQAFRALDSDFQWQDWLYRTWGRERFERMWQRAQYCMTDPEARGELFPIAPRPCTQEDKQQLLELWCRYFISRRKESVQDEPKERLICLCEQ